MTASAEPPPLILMATGRHRAGMRGYDSERYRVLTVPSGTILCRWTRDLRPDVVMLDAELDDMTGPEACRALCAALQVGQEVPILMLTNGTPTPAERIAALRAGAWDCFEAPHSADQLALQCETYLAAKRGLDSVLGRGLFDPATGLYTRTGLARRARELGALMARTHSALACLVFAPANGGPEAETVAVVARTARTSDVVGMLSSTELALLAPATGPLGAVELARRIAGALDRAPRIGYDAVANLGYTPLDPTELLVNAAAAVRRGTPDPDTPWVRRFDSDRVSGRHARITPGASPAPATSTERKPPS